MSGDNGQRRICVDTLAECERSAQFWTGNLGIYADRLQARANRHAIIAGIISAITSLAAWPALSSSPGWWARLFVSGLALSAAVVAIIPTTLNYSDGAQKATSLIAEYGHHIGVLRDARIALEEGTDVDEDYLRSIHAAFEATKVKKDAVRPFPRKLQAQRNVEERTYKVEHRVGRQLLAGRA
jgi:hypothetical protein